MKHTIIIPSAAFSLLLIYGYYIYVEKYRNYYELETQQTNGAINTVRKIRKELRLTNELSGHGEATRKVSEIVNLVINHGLSTDKDIAVTSPRASDDIFRRDLHTRTTLDEVMRSLDSDKNYTILNGDYIISPIYYTDNKTLTGVNRCSITPLSRRESLFLSLKRWIEFAHENEIIWWLTYGSLLGSVRDNHMIPYDSDFDIAILGSDEEKIRALATDRKDIKSGRFNIVVRPGPHCVHNPGVRMSCYGVSVPNLVDTCAFCGPLARMFHFKNQYIDIYPVHLVSVDESDNSTNAVKFHDEGTQGHSEKRTYYNMDTIIPLQTCKMMGLFVPCPNISENILEQVYGLEFRHPNYLCDPKSGDWIKR